MLEQIVDIRTVGSGAIAVTRVQTTEPWLNATPRQVDDKGIGSYSIRVDHGSLPDGVYRAFVEFATDLGTVVKVQVNMRVGDFAQVGNAGYLYVLLIDANLGAVTMVGQGAAVEGQYAYHFDDVPLGDYYIAAGSDINNDTYVCDLGESCGFYPSIAEEAVIRVDSDRTDLNFPAGLTPRIGVESTNAESRGLSRELFHY